MFVKLVFASLLVNSLYLLIEGSIGLNQTRSFILIRSEIADLKSEHALIRTDQQLIKANQQVMRSDLGIIKSEQHQLKENDEQIKEELIRNKAGQEKMTSDLKIIQEELTLLKTGQTRLESMLNILIDKYKSISDTNKTEEEVTKQTPKVFIGRSCAESMSTSRHSGIFEILIPRYSEKPFKVACDAETHGGNWTIILRRMDGSEEFYRKWAEYKEGFGSLTGEFFIGLDKLHALTHDQRQELLVLLENNQGEVKYESYDEFAIGNESELYKLHTLGEASGTAGDSFKEHYGMKFTSQDNDNDESTSNCAVDYTSGWWYKNCYYSNLMGKYNQDTNNGIIWQSWTDWKNSLKRAVMMIRPKKI